MFLGWVDACRVVGAGVQKDDGAGGRFLYRGEHAIEVETFGLGGEVGVLGEGETDIGENLLVVGPRGVGEVDCWFLGVEFCEEETT